MTRVQSARADVAAWLASPAFEAEPVIAVDGPPLVLDLGRGSSALGEALEGLTVERFSALIDAAMARAGTRCAYGRWGEERALYSSEHFAGEGGERRSVHLGVDLFCAAGTPVHSPLPAVVEIVANNARELDYGPMVILRHRNAGGLAFFTLYGHLGPECLDTLRAGQRLDAGEVFANVGGPPVNGNWPPHLHFQVVLDLLDLGREFPGVARPSEARRWLALSPNPAPFFPGVSAAELDGRAERN